MTIEFDRTDLLNLAFAVSSSAASSYIDERLCTAAAEYRLAARLWTAGGYTGKGQHYSILAQAIDAEMIELSNEDAA